MTEFKLGNKYECFNCGIRFYDLGKGEPVCPKCGSDQKAAEEGEPPLVTQATRRKRSVATSDAEDDEEDDVPVLDAEDLEDEDLDDEELSAELEDEELDLDDEEEEDDEP
jgi:hypothetical protein